MTESDNLATLLTEQTNPASSAIDQLDTEAMLRVINAQDDLIVASVAREIPRIAQAVDAIAASLSTGGRLFYIGAGTSGRLGVLDASECPPTFGVPPELVQGIIAGGEKALHQSTEASEDSPESGVRDVIARGLRAQDVLVGIAASGRTPYVLGAVQYARQLGARTIGISCTPNSLLSQGVDVAIEPLPGPEVVAGSTRLKAGTATKLVLNMLSTGAMIRMGYVFGNLMVNVQPRNEKLVNRATRIVASATGLPESDAGRLFDESGKDVRTAIVMARLDVSRDEAERRLSAAGGRLRAALG
ncbi:MAG: N-acetylmuramic acid 6-phosphate etherase [Bryobacteraceae bacterium]